MIRRTFVLVLAFALLSAGPASARVVLHNFMRTSTTATSAGLGIYQYGSGTPITTDFLTGTHTGTVENSGALELASNLSDWVDPNWNRRQCFTVNAAAAVPEYPLRFEVDTSGSTTTGTDVRVHVGPNGALLPSYSEGPFASTASVVWAKVAPLPAGASTYCVYFENAAASDVSNEGVVFDVAGTTFRYYTMLDTYTPAARLEVYSYTDNNTVSDGTTTVVLPKFGSHTFRGVNKDTVITSTGAIEGSAERNGVETLLPESFAHNEFVFPVQRGTEGAWVRTPFGATTIQAWVNGIIVNSVPVTPAMGSVWISGPFAGANTLKLDSLDGTEFLAMYKSTANNDVAPAVHNYGDPIYGVRSRTVWTGAVGSANITLRGSDGTNVTATATEIASHRNVDNTDGRGNGTAFEVTSDGAPIASFQFADQNGSEITTFYPTRKLAETWIAPVRSGYITVACPTNPTTVTIAGTNFACTGAAGFPGFVYGGRVNRPAGVVITADNPIYVYYETRSFSDEHNLLGVRNAIPRAAGLTIIAGAVETLGGRCGNWESAAFGVSGVFGRAGVSATVPPEGTVTYQISVDASPFYGPDGTALTSFAAGDVVPYVADFGSSVVLRIEMCSTHPTITPSVSSFSLASNLVELVGDHGVTTAVALASPAAGTNEPVLRIYQHDPGTWLGAVEYADGLNLPAVTASFDTDHPSTQVTVAAGAPTSPSPTFSHTTAEPYSLWVNHATATSQVAEVEIDIVDSVGYRVESSVRFTFIG